MFAYKGVTATGKNVKGQLSAESLRAARARMRKDGVYLTEIDQTTGAVKVAEVAPGGGAIGRLQNLGAQFSRRIPALERAVATRQLATLVGAGIPLVESLGALVDQIEHNYLKSVFGRVRERVNEGASLADALDATGEFDNLYVSMIRAGEASGALSTVLLRIADYLEDQVRLGNKLGSIIIYPAFMLLFTVAVVAALVTVVLPQITTLLLSLEQELPFYTVWIIQLSSLVRDWWWAGLAGMVGGWLGFRALVRTERGRSAYDRVLLRLPVVGRIVRVVAIARFSRTLATLLASGVGIIQGLDISRYVANNTVVAGVLDMARTQVLEGATLAAPLRSSGEFPPLVTTMIEVGERSGELESMLGKVADTYDEQVESTISKLTALLEPLLILVMVGIVLVIILATLMPLLQVTNSLG